MSKCKFLKSHNYITVGILYQTVTWSYKHHDNKDRVSGYLSFMECSHCDHHKVGFTVNEGTDKKFVEGFKETFLRDEDMGSLIAYWESGLDNPPIDMKKIGGDFMSKSPIHFVDSYIDSLILNTKHDTMKFYAMAENKSPATKEALDQIEESLKNLQTIIKLQKQND